MIASNVKFLRNHKKSILNKYSGGQLAIFIIASIILFIFAMTYVIAFLWAAFAATKTHSEVIIAPFAWHSVWNFRNYIDVFSVLSVRGVNVVGMIINSLWLAFGGAFLAIIGPTLMAYAIVKFEFFWKKLLISINFIVLIVPIIGALPSSYKIISSMGLVDSPMILLTKIGSFGANLLILMSFFRNLSNEYREAAIVDGAGEYKILFSIIIPLAKGPIFALFVMGVVGVWNDYMTALLYLPNLPTLATGVYLFRVQMVYTARMDLLLAATVITAIPPLIVYTVFNKTILTNVSIGGIKG